MRRVKSIILLCSLLLVIDASGWADIKSVSLRGGVEKLSGHSTYQIGYPYSDDTGTYGGYFPFSELRFPLDVYMALCDITVMTDTLKMQAEYTRNITDDTGYMEDSDWLTSSDTSQLDVFSESETNFEGDTCNISLYYAMMRRNNVTLFLGGGFLYQDYSFESFDTDQWYPSNPSQAHVYVPGKTITYDVTFYIPYAAINATYLVIPSLELGATLTVSPYTIAKDKDVHLARVPVRISEGDYSGFSCMLGFEAAYFFSDIIFCDIAFDYLYISVTGEQYKTTTDGDWQNITAEIKSSQMRISLSVGCRFELLPSRSVSRDNLQVFM